MVWKQFIKSDSYSNVIKIDKNTEMAWQNKGFCEIKLN